MALITKVTHTRVSPEIQAEMASETPQASSATNPEKKKGISFRTAWKLWKKWQRLDHTQLTYLIQFNLSIYRWVPRSLKKELLLFELANQLVLMARRKYRPDEEPEERAADSVRPHEMAQAYLLFAEVTRVINFNKKTIEEFIKRALSYEDLARVDTMKTGDQHQLIAIYNEVERLQNCAEMREAERLEREAGRPKKVDEDQ